MADVIISNLPQIAATTVSGSDVMIINDTSANTTMKITLNDLMRRGSRTLYWELPENVTLSDGTNTYTRIPTTAYVSNSGLCSFYMHIIPTAVLTNSGSTAQTMAMLLHPNETSSTIITMQGGLFNSAQRYNNECVNGLMLNNRLILQTNTGLLTVPANGSITVTGGLVGQGFIYNTTADSFWIET